MDYRLEQFATAVTAGLQPDPEMRLQVRADLLQRLRRNAEVLRAAGHTEEDSCELALSALGTPEQLAGTLSAANNGRMKRRLWTRHFICWLLVPAARC